MKHITIKGKAEKLWCPIAEDAERGLRGPGLVEMPLPTAEGVELVTVGSAHSALATSVTFLSLPII